MTGGTSFAVFLIALATPQGILTEFCDPYVDRQGQLQEGFRCPVKEIVPSGGKNFNGEESYCCGSCIYKFCCNTIENRVDQSDCELGNLRAPQRPMVPKPENVSTTSKAKIPRLKEKVKEFEVIDPMDEGGTVKVGGNIIEEKDPEKGFVEIVKDGVKIKLDQAIDKAKDGDIGDVIGVIVTVSVLAIIVVACLIMCVVCCCRKSKSRRHLYRGPGGSIQVKRSLSSASLHHDAAAVAAAAKADAKRHSALYPSIPNTPLTASRYSSAGRLSKVRNYISYSLPHSRGREPRQPLWGPGGSRKSFNAQAFFSRQQMRNLQDRYNEGGNDSDGSGTATPSPVRRPNRKALNHCNTMHGGGVCTCHGAPYSNHGGCGGACANNHAPGTCGGGGVRPQSCCVSGANGGPGGYSNYPPPPNMTGNYLPQNGMIPQAFANPYACPYPNPNQFSQNQSSGMGNPGNLPPSMIASYPPPNQTPAMSPFASNLYPQVSQALNDMANNGVNNIASTPVPENEGTQPTAPPPTGSLTQPPAFNPHYV